MSSIEPPVPNPAPAPTTPATPTVGSETRPLAVAIIGSGPSGFYAADALLKNKDLTIRVDMFDRLPTPFGLARGGVAPDHPKIKSVTRIYEKTATHPNFRFFGNVRVGADIALADLATHYDQIVFAVGNEKSKPMGIPGEDLPGVSAASTFVGWYNAHPDYRDAQFDLSVKRAAVIGNGNVAMDVARILAKSSEELAKTDIAEHALNALRTSAIEEIVVLGRRGPVQAAFSPTELKELNELASAWVSVEPADLELDEFSAAELSASGPNSPAADSLTTMQTIQNGAENKTGRKIRFRFFVSPVEVIAGADGKTAKLKIEHNKLVKDANGSVQAQGSGVFEEIEAGLVLVSIGYYGSPIEGCPFDNKRGIIPNNEGRVVNEKGETIPGRYAVGWAMSGPRGLIGTNKAVSNKVVKLMFDDLAEGKIAATPLPAKDALPALLKAKGVIFVTFEDWQLLDQIETNRGALRGAPRVKFSRVNDMLIAMGKVDDSRWH